MKNVATIGLDIAKEVFQVHGADADGAPLFNRKLRRAELLEFFGKLPPCVVGIEACSTSHDWARRIAQFGHEVRLIHPIYVKPFVKRGKTDAADAEAINEALTRKAMRFVPVKSMEQQASAMVFRARAMFVRQRTQAVNALRGHLAELGIATGRGMANVRALTKLVGNGSEDGLPAAARFAMSEIADQIEFLQQRIAKLDHEILVRARDDGVTKRLMTVPGIGAITALAIKSLVHDPDSFKSARHFAAWIGLTPKSHSSGASQTLVGISKMGNSQLRTLLVTGAMSVLMHLKADDKTEPWLSRLKNRRPFKVAAVALANKTARIVWALLTKGGIYRERRVIPTLVATTSA
ncbi:IS110 family transposase [Ensifer sp. 22564]|uniref:IS110 family transposase n=1 Tax=unclassified Ensifer TaxID=2633371 RepID=UPI003F832BB9